MFQLKSHPKQIARHSAHWHEQFRDTALKRRVVSKSHTKPYQPHTLAESIHAVCMKTFGFSGEAEATALRVVRDIEAWLQDKEEVTSADIKRKAAQFLQKYNPRAAYEYLPVKELEVREDEYGFVRL